MASSKIWPSAGGVSSGYGTTSSSASSTMATSDEESASRRFPRKGSEWKASSSSSLDSNCFPGICPHCKNIYTQPVTLTCGHSLCLACSEWLLSSLRSAVALRPAVGPCRIRMGISSFSRTSLPRTNSDCSLKRVSPPPPAWLSPQCVVCGEPPKKTAPVPNRDLDAFISTLRSRQERREEVDEEERERLIHSHFSPFLSHSLSFFHSPDSPEAPRSILWDCNVAIVGARGVGKTSIKQTQFSNDMLVEDLLAGGRRGCVSSPAAPIPISYSSPLRRRNHRRSQQLPTNKFMLNMLDSSCSLDEKLCSARGFLIVYSITDRDSFKDAHALFNIILNARGAQVPIALLGAKADLSRRRAVAAFEGQQLARLFNSPFIECSARKNDCVNEAFVELSRVIEARGFLSKEPQHSDL